MAETGEPLRIDEMYAFIASDEDGEGVIGFLTRTGWMPMVGADLTRIESLRPLAQEIANGEERVIKLVKFSTREELEVINPKQQENK